MIKARALLAVSLLLSVGTIIVHASGPIGIYGIVEKVVFEPNEQTPERIQVWGAFAYADSSRQQLNRAFSDVKKGYLYFTNPSRSEVTVREWRDLKAVAGTGQAIAFGSWIYIGGFPTQPDQRAPYGIYQPSGGAAIDLRVRPASEVPADPAIYVSDAGMFKLTNDGSHAELVKLLKEALQNKN